MNKIYITTPLYYVNDVPHIGHAYTTIAADVLSRHYKAKGNEVFLLTGTDEHGAKIADAAKRAGKDPKDFADELVPKFIDTWKNLDVKYDEFFRTTDPKHEEVVKDFIKKLKDKGHIEKKSYEGWYCIGCEKYLSQEDLVDGKCPDHKTEPVKQFEENYFFLLSKFQERLIKAIESGELDIAPISRKNEILGKIKQGLQDVSISRENVRWGIKFPGDEKQTVYVWVDALINYYSATKIYKELDDWESHPADIHLIGKDILWFHAVIWPAMLVALDLPLPKKIFAHGFFTIGGEKMSKTIGNILDPNKLVDKFGADALRYALLREFPFGEDGDISEEKIAKRYENDLANGLGNLLNRTISMINKNGLEKDTFQIKKVVPDTLTVNGVKFSQDEYYAQHMKNFSFDDYLHDIWWLYIKTSNELIDREKPWELAKKNKNLSVLYHCYKELVQISYLLNPFMPKTAEKMSKQLKTLKPELLFPKLDK